MVLTIVTIGGASSSPRFPRVTGLEIVSLTVTTTVFGRRVSVLQCCLSRTQILLETEGASLLGRRRRSQDSMAVAGHCRVMVTGLVCG